MASRVVGLDNLMRKYGQLGEQVAQEAMKKAIGASTKLIQGQAKLLCPVDSGELRNSIKTAVETQDGVIIGTVYTNKEYAQYVEFGTGLAGEANHEGISLEVTVSYSKSPWWIHESQVDKETAEKYHWFYIDTKNGRFYQCTGQPAQPFMYPALKNNEERVTRNISNYLAREIKKVCKT